MSSRCNACPPVLVLASSCPFIPFSQVLSLPEFLLQGLMVSASLAVELVFVYFAFKALRTRRSKYSSTFTLLASAVLLNEFFLKNLMAEKRPEDSCSVSYGTPSTLAMLSSALLTHAVLQRIHSGPVEFT